MRSNATASGLICPRGRREPAGSGSVVAADGGLVVSMVWTITKLLFRAGAGGVPGMALGRARGCAGGARRRPGIGLIGGAAWRSVGPGPRSAVVGWAGSAGPHQGRLWRIAPGPAPTNVSSWMIMCRLNVRRIVMVTASRRLGRCVRCGRGGGRGKAGQATTGGGGRPVPACATDGSAGGRDGQGEQDRVAVGVVEVLVGGVHGVRGYGLQPAEGGVRLRPGLQGFELFGGQRAGLAGDGVVGGHREDPRLGQVLLLGAFVRVPLGVVVV